MKWTQQQDAALKDIGNWRRSEFMLTEIHRQALDNPIIRMSMDVRQGRLLKTSTDYGKSRVVLRKQLSEQDYNNADRILVGRNAKRKTINKKERTRKNFSPEHPVKGDKIVCLRNNHDLGLYNGTLWHVEDIDETAGELRMSIKADDNHEQTRIVLSHTSFFNPLDAEPTHGNYEPFDYGYALTVHKAQGSQWHNVLLFDEARYFREHAHRWLYTGITRASNCITVAIL
jgi:exodeoxyribonuclease-5